ncbi:MAG TPA: 16S rRNA (guanine(966)-N(2))-methyltransferase RsmD [Candidatus Acidoferrales bacterium]|nr:16S rRNA (guanine(966)-N(2))-methyltransferase RsmD [Candidatus Acidoferrales bacterium]
MRITGGTLRSRKLLTIKSDGLRPATDRLRETLFDILVNLFDFQETTALDLYAGTGSVGFEAISRGTHHVLFVEANPKVADVLGKNVKALGIEDKCRIHIMKTEKYLKLCEENFDFIFIDPPYAFNSMTHKIVDEILTKGIIKKSGIICVEHSKEYVPPASNLFRQKIFGSTILSFIKPEIR